MTAIRVQLPASPARHYDIQIEPGLINRLGEAVAGAAKASNAVVISDSNVAPLYGQQAVQSLARAGLPATLLTFPAGEQHKHLATVSRLWDDLAGLSIERSTPVIALGGGVVGDVAGFAAACYLRGLPVVQAPTTLLACVDSAVGGKTGVDHPVAGKNIIGAFHQPRAVLIDPLLLATLPRRQWACGLAESVKHGVSLDGRFLEWLERRAGELADVAADAGDRLGGHVDEIIELIAWNCRIKAAVVAADERESDLRAVLNFGHTIGHALEAICGFGQLQHGEAVSIGLVVETRIAVRRGLAPREVLDRAVRLLVRLGLPVSVPPSVSAEQICRLAAKDKKVRAGKVRFVLSTGIGQTRIVDDVTAGEVTEALGIGMIPDA